MLGFSSSFSFVKVLSLAVQPGCPARNTGYNTLTCHFCLLSLSVSSSLYLFLSLSALADFFISLLRFNGAFVDFFLALIAFILVFHLIEEIFCLLFEKSNDHVFELLTYL